MRISVARTAPDSRLKTASIAACGTADILHVELHHGPNFDRAVLRSRDLRCKLERLIEILAVEEIEPAQLLLRLSEGTVGRHRLSVPDAHRGRRADELESLAPEVNSQVLHLLGEREVSAEVLLPALRRPARLGLFVPVDQQ